MQHRWVRISEIFVLYVTLTMRHHPFEWLLSISYRLYSYRLVCLSSHTYIASIDSESGLKSLCKNFSKNFIWLKSFFEKLNLAWSVSTID